MMKFDRVMFYSIVWTILNCRLTFGKGEIAMRITTTSRQSMWIDLGVNSLYWFLTLICLALDLLSFCNNNTNNIPKKASGKWDKFPNKPSNYEWNSVVFEVMTTFDAFFSKSFTFDYYLQLEIENFSNISIVVQVQTYCLSINETK